LSLNITKNWYKNQILKWDRDVMRRNPTDRWWRIAATD